MTRLLTLAVLASCETRAADNVTVAAQREGDAVRVSAHAVLRATPPVVWRTLTDYEHLAEFIPGMQKSKVVGHEGAATIVAQTGEAHLLLFSYPIDVTVASVLHPPNEIRIHLIRGNLKQLDGGYRIKPLAGGRLALDWSGLIRPELALPPLIGEVLVRRSIEDQFLGMVREIERRVASADKASAEWLNLR
ncbi:MAG TPA: SRPBCC family protein [Burkholderiales bacterium]|nr:SRPBCC family protein [Burkholderiales bacterium]